MIRHFLLAIAVISAAAAHTFAQAVSEPQPICNADFAKFLVSQVAGESGSVANTGKRVKILIRSADSIWKYDEPAARGYFATAFKVASDAFKANGFEQKNQDGLIIREPDARFEVIKAIAAKDGKWAKELTDKLLKEMAETAADRKKGDETREIDSLMQVAAASLKADPALSMYLYRRAMSAPLTERWLFALSAAAAVDITAANTLYRELLTNYANETPRRLLYLSAYPFARDRVFGIDKYMYGTGLPESIRPQPDLEQAFISTFLRRVVAYANDPNDINRPAEEYFKPEPIYMTTALDEMEPIVIRSFPSLLQPFTEARSAAGALMSDAMRATRTEKEKQNEVLGSGFDARLAALEKADEEGKLKDYDIAQLVTWQNGNLSDEQFEKLLPWLEKISDIELRTQTTGYFWFLRAKLAIKEKRIADAQAFASKVPELDHRAVLLIEAAELQLRNVNERQQGKEILDEIAKLADRAEDSVAKARVLLGLASLYETIDHVSALSELSDAVKVINRLEEPDMLSRSIFRMIKGKGFAFYAMLSMPKFDLESAFDLLSRNDLDMTLSNARALEDKYLRTIAVLASAKNCIDKAPVRSRKGPGAKNKQ